MHSKWKIWDFVHSRPHVLTDDSPAIIIFETFSPFVMKFIKSRINLDKIGAEKLYNKLGSELTPDWIDDNFKSLSLFGNNDSFYVINAHEMPKKVKASFLEADALMLENRYVILDYPKEDEILKELKKNEKIEVVKIEAPAFWEKDKLLNFLCEEHKVYLDYEAKEFFLEYVDDSIEAYSNYLAQLSLNFSDKKQLSKNDLETLIFQQRWDQFDLADLFCSRQFNKFYQKISQTQSYEELRKLAQFLQSHLIKVADPSYTQKKSRLTKYDKSILKQKDLWSHKDINKAVKYFVEMEILAKSKNEKIFQLITRDYLRLTL